MHVPVNRVFNNVSRNLGLKEYSQHIDSWAEWAFEAEQYIGSLDTFLEKEITYTDGAPEAATAEIEFENNTLNKSYIEIGGTRFYFRDPSFSSYIAEEDYFILIAGSLDLTMANAVTKLNESYYENLKGISASWDSASKTLTLTYVRSGDEGNHVTLNTSGKGKIKKFFSGGKERMQNQQIRLPDNLVNVISVRVGNTIIFPTSSQFKGKVSSATNKYYINGNRLNLSNDSYTDDVVVAYLSVALSEEGYPMVKQGHEEAVATYIMWKHKSIEYYSGKVPQYLIKDLEKRWYWLCGQVRGNDNMPNAGELLKIGKVWNSKTRPRRYDGLNAY